LNFQSFLIVVLPSNQIKLKLVVIIWLLSNRPTKQLCSAVGAAQAHMASSAGNCL